ncbi:16S rRNA (cytidine(1402)-2'-O)-methyltransferase [Qingshengfaniella alkalisoli]|uniref:16S rRNA (cytidine(1402)-2'-O)-methyltransferase n=1 Tax=Qingshengfaniella alkalisoli TaxID=2599296 RepID=UPI00197BD59C|nr:16S rRNA (cytidine(1402)-2'-O)-methyltransferase [Qingshengfaniella alkalisoli]
MNFEKTNLQAGLYLVATPIGTARDITLRALDLLASADALVAEDTRSLRHLMMIHGVPLDGRKVIAYHDHSKPASRAGIVALIAGGRSVAYASEAGTPLIADPGYHLVRDVLAAGFSVTSAPGPSAAINAMALAGLPTDRFLFLGFLPNKSKARREALKPFVDLPVSVILYESPKRVAALLDDLSAVAGGDRPVALCREMTKRFEQVRRGTVADVAQTVQDDPPRGECVLIVGPGEAREVDEADLEAALRAELVNNSLKDAAQIVADRFGAKKRQVYQLALSLNDGAKG